MEFCRSLAILAVMASLSGCASIIKGQSQTVSITTPPTTGAACVVSNTLGSWRLISPGAVTLQRSKVDAQVRCTKDGWQDGFGTMPSNFEGWTVANVIGGGVIGLGIDAATGAINQYPSTFQVPMQPLGVINPP